MPKLSYLFSFIVLLIIPLAGMASAQADSVEIRQLLEERDQEIKHLMGPKGTDYTEEKRGKLKHIINDIVDYRAMAQHALQETYDTLTDAQRDEFVALFSTIIRDQSLNKLDIYRADVTYQAIDVSGNEATVNTMAVLDNVRTPVTYTMRQNENMGEWVITDMVIDDVSTAGSYQRQFQNIIRKRGYEHLLKILRDRAAR